MTGKVIDNSSAGILILIIPVAFATLVLYKLWPILLAMAVLIVAWKIWQNYQWQKWCSQVNPYFNAVIRENKGYLTPVDLSVKANLTPRGAKLFLERKAEEYGMPPKTVKGKGKVYYFPTASALGSIFDDSEPMAAWELDAEAEAEATEPALVAATQAPKPSAKTSTLGIAQLAKQEQSQSETTEVHSVSANSSTATATLEEEESVEEIEEQVESENGLIQAELAKRLDLNSSTVGRRKCDPDFPEWSQSKDPEGVAWKYVSSTKLFIPANDP